VVLPVLAGCAPSVKRPARTPASARLGSADIVVFAPHPDDESIACGGVIQQALAADKRVRIVVFTNGDGYPRAASALRDKPEASLAADDYIQLARTRQLEELAAARILGLRPSQVTFLGYPDAGLDKVYQTEGASPFQQEFTRKSETFGPAQTDYHFQVHGRTAAYTRSSALDDAVEIIQDTSPSQIYVSSAADTHADHRAAFWFVLDAVTAAGYQGKLSTFIVHTEPHATYPCPMGFTPRLPFVPCAPFDGAQLIKGLPWPPPERVPVTPRQAERKLAAVRAHRSQYQLEGEGTYLESFVKSEEVFWPVDLPKSGDTTVIPTMD
jgi:LmbE family N-acetylglucosaminyl deacetylase